MRESSTYQAILAEGEAAGEAKGRVDEARRNLLRLGTKRFGAPEPDVSRGIEQIKEIARLEELLDRLLEVENWNELLA